MKSIAKLKDEARRHEQREEWEKAMSVYLVVLEESAESETEVELPLYNRVGDLCVRLGRPQDAVRYYEQAADRYAEAGLYNNAIALCNKALRYNGDNLELLKKLGQFSASQGFLTDARRYFLEYAEKKAATGKVNEALNALEDFANVSDDAEIRELLGRKLQQHGRSEEAVAELRRALALRVKANQTEAAESLRAEIRAIDPKASFEDTGARAQRPSSHAQPDSATVIEDEEEADLPGLIDIDPGATLSGAGLDMGTSAEPSLLAGFETGRGDDDDVGFALDLPGFDDDPLVELADFSPPASGTLEGFESTTLEIAEVEPLPGLDVEHDQTSFDDAAFDLPTLDDPADSNFDLPTLDDGGDSFALPSLDDADGTDDAFALPTLDGGFDLPTLDDEEEGASFDLPTLGDTDEFGLPEQGTSFDLPSLDEEDTSDSTEDDAFELPTLDDGDDEEPAADDSFALPLIGSADEEGEPSEPDLGDLTLAGSSTVEAEIEPESETEPAETGTELSRGADIETGYAPPPDTGGDWTPDMSLPPEKAAAPKAPAPKNQTTSPADGYVDLNDFLADDPQEGTRFRVQETAPTGDEDRDFADMLNQFRAKVSEHLPAEDAAAHYDLGLAFKEMGLVDEAISEFQISLRSGHLKMKVYEELGQCFLTKQQYNIAEKVLRRAMDMKYDDELELIGVYYHLGRAYEGMNQRDQARDAYERVLGMDINFQDVMERLARL